MSISFSGIPHEAADFYARLEAENTKAFWAAHQAEYVAHVREPMTALLGALEDEFGAGHAFRPHRDVRFAADKTPFKTHQGIFVKAAPAAGWYAEVSADGFRHGAGCYHMDAPALAAFRQAVDGPRGGELEGILGGLQDAGWEVTGDQLKTAPRGWSRDHPRIDLLRHRSVSVMQWIDDGDVVTSPALADAVREGWRDLRPLVEWFADVIPPE